MSLSVATTLVRTGSLEALVTSELIKAAIVEAIVGTVVEQVEVDEGAAIEEVIAPEGVASKEATTEGVIIIEIAIGEVVTTTRTIVANKVALEGVAERAPDGVSREVETTKVTLGESVN